MVSGDFTRRLLPREQVIRKGVGQGPLAGGNLATLVHLLGTPFQPDLAGTVLFIEDVGEPAYKIEQDVKSDEDGGYA